MNLEKFKQFPHIFRKITAGLVSLKKAAFTFLQSLAPERKQIIVRLSPLFFLIIYFLFTTFYPSSDFEKIKDRVIKNPQDLQNHLLLAEQFKNNHQYQEALREIDFARKLNPQNSNLLTKRQEIVGEINKPERLKEELDYWKNLTIKFPNYRDAYLTKSLLEYRLKNFFSSAKDLALVLNLDPNFATAQKLKGILEEMGYQVNQ